MNDKAVRYKFQALVTLEAPAPDATATQIAGNAAAVMPPDQLRRVVLRAQHHEQRKSQFFSALLSNNGDGDRWLESDHAIVTIALVGAELQEYFDVGDPFSLWLGHDTCHGIVTRRVFA